MKNKGYVTVFTVLLMTALVSFLFFMLELVYVQLADRKASEMVSANMEGLFGDFDRDLFEAYHLLGIDASYGTENCVYLEERLKGQLTDSLRAGKQLFALKLTDVRLQTQTGFQDDGHASLKKQIQAYAAYAVSDQLIARLKNRDDTGAQGTPENAAGAGTAQDTTEAPPGDQTQFQDPRGLLSGLTGDLLLKTVCPENAFPSAEQADLRTLPSKGTADKKTGDPAETAVETPDFMAGTGVQTLLEEKAFDWKLLEASKERLALAAYIEAVFGHYPDAPSHTDCTSRVLRAEQEYILYGAASDRDNVLHTVHALIRLRMPFNYLYLQRAPEKLLWIQAASVAIGAATATAPSAVRALLLGAVCYGESVLDVRTLLHGEPVPLQKTAATWRLSFAALFGNRLSGRTLQTEKGLRYADYLSILILTKLSPEVMYDRILDLITIHRRESQPEFSFATVLTQAGLSYHMEVIPRFAGWPKRRNAAFYQMLYVRELAY